MQGAGGVSSPENLMERLYEGQTTGSEYGSFEALNGQLQGDNFDRPDMITHKHIQPGTLANGKMVGLTGNANYRASNFFSASSADHNFRVIPGSAIEFYLPDNALVMFTWMIGGANATMFADARYTDLAFVLNDWRGVAPNRAGNTAPTGYRRISDSVHDPGPGASADTEKFRIHRPHRNRVWSGHYATELTSGWHKAGIVAYQRDKNLKLRVRNMKVIWFRKLAST